LATGMSDTRGVLPSGTRTGTSQGPAVSRETSQHPAFFDTLEYRESGPEREAFPQVPERRAGSPNSRTIPRERLRRNDEVDPMAARMRTGAARRRAEPQADGQARDGGWGEPQGGRNPGEPGCAARERSDGGGTPTGSGTKPLKRRRRCGSGDPAATRQSQEGMSRREARRSLPCQALKGEPRGRARPRHAGEAAQGARRRGGREPRGRNMTRETEAPGVVALRGRVASRGEETSGERCVGSLRRAPRGETRAIL